MTSLKPRITLGVLDDSVSSSIMGAIRNITRERFSWTHTNRLSNKILKLAIAVFPPRINFAFLPNMIFETFSLLNTSLSICWTNKMRQEFFVILNTLIY